MPRRGSSRGGRESGSVLGKRRRNAAGESADSEYYPRTSGHSARQPRATGRAEGARIRPKDVAASRDKSTTSATTATSTKSGPYDPAFEQHLFEHNVMPFVYPWRHGERPKPASNIAEIKAEVRAARNLEPAEDFERFQGLYDRAVHEDKFVSMLDVLEGDAQAVSQSHVIRGNQKMSKLRPLTDGTIRAGNPDRMYGAAADELRPWVRNDLKDLIVPMREENFICPNFVVHVKSDRGDLTVARAQAAYDGALAARGMQSIWAYGNRSDSTPEVPSGIRERQDRTEATSAGSDVLTVANPDASLARVARTITCTWHGGTLMMYATYCQEEPAPDDGVLAGNFDYKFPRYASTFIGSWNMTNEEKPFREGLAAYRNGLDWAKKQRDIVIDRANAKPRPEAAPGHRGEEQASEDLGANEDARSDGQANLRGEENEQANNFEEGGSSEEDDDGPTSIFARRGSGARRQDEEDEDSDPADGDVAQSFDSQRTVTTRSMSRRLLERDCS